MPIFILEVDKNQNKEKEINQVNEIEFTYSEHTLQTQNDSLQPNLIPVFGADLTGLKNNLPKTIRQCYSYEQFYGPVGIPTYLENSYSQPPTERCAHNVSTRNVSNYNRDHKSPWYFSPQTDNLINMLPKINHDITPYSQYHNLEQFKDKVLFNKTTVHNHNVVNTQDDEAIHHGVTRFQQPNRHTKHLPEHLYSHENLYLCPQRFRKTWNRPHNSKTDHTNSVTKTLANINSTKYFSNDPISSDRQDKLVQIEEIFETYVPAMSSTNISQNFIHKLINLHKNRTNKDKLQQFLISTESSSKHSSIQLNQIGYTPSPVPSKDDIKTYFISIEDSFVKFARSNKLFNTLSKKNQSELLNRNSLLFVKVRTSKYTVLIYNLFIFLLK